MPVLPLKYSNNLLTGNTPCGKLGVARGIGCRADGIGHARLFGIGRAEAGGKIQADG